MTTTTPTSGAADLLAMVSKSLREAYNLGQRYWQQADSEYISRHKKADGTRAKFLALVEETCATLAAGQATAAPAQPVAQQGVAYAALPDEGEPWHGHKFKEVQRGCWRCDCGKTIKEVTSDQSTPASGGNYPVMPKRYTVDDDGEELFTAEKMHAFADATHALRASRGQAPAQPTAAGCLQHLTTLQEQAGMYADDFTPQAAQQAPAGVTLRSMIEGMSVSVDVSTGDHDAGHRYFGTVTEVMECQGDKHGVTLLVQDAEPNFAAPTPQAAQPAPATHALRASHWQAPAQPVDFTTLGAAMRAIQQAIGLIGDHADERMQAVRRVLRGAVVVAEDSGDIPAQPDCLTCSDHGAVGNILTAEPCPDCTRWNAQTADSVQEDAARYRWLRRWKGQEHEPPFTVQHEIDGTLWGGDLDAAIDAAMNKGGA